MGKSASFVTTIGALAAATGLLASGCGEKAATTEGNGGTSPGGSGGSAQGGSGGSGGSAQGGSAGSAPGVKVLAKGDFAYLGHYRVKRNGDFPDLNYGQGFTHRYVKGELRFLTYPFFGNVPGGGYHLVEFAPPADLGGEVTARTNHWPDIYPGIGWGGNGAWQGLWYEQEKERLWTTWAIDYPDDIQASYTTSLVVRKLNDDGTVSDLRGPWGLEGVQQRRIYGGVTGIPGWFQMKHGVGPYGAGWGGYASRMSLGVSLGPTFFAFPEPTAYPDSSDIPKADFKVLMDHGSGTVAQDWYAEGEPKTFDRGVRNTNVKNEYDSGSWTAPAPDGLGRWVWGDSAWNTGVWIDGPKKHGFVIVPKFASKRAWYEGSTLHCEEQTAEIQVFDPEKMAEVGAGQRQPWEMKPDARWEINDELKPFGLLGGIGGNSPAGGPGGASYDATTQRLYVYTVAGDQLDSFILVYQVHQD